MSSVRICGLAFLLLFAVVRVEANGQPKRVSFPTEDGGTIYADLYGKGERAVVLAHGGRFNKESWGKQASILMKTGFKVLAIDFRGYGQSKGPGDKEPMSAPLYLDILAAVRYLHQTGSRNVSVVGGSMGGTAAADASIHAKPGEIDRIVLIGAAGGGPPEKLMVPKLFIVTREDTRGDGVVRLTKIQEQFEKAPGVKKLKVLEGSAHAQAIFATPQGEQLMNEILQFLSET
jgi:esterase/lipase